MALPDLTAVKDYLDGNTSATDAQIGDALAAETAAQARRCRIPEEYPIDLAQALKRRVARNLAMRGVPLGVQVTGDLLTARLSSVDPEVRRLEAPYAKLVKG